MRSATSAVSAGARRRAQAITETSHIYAESSAAGELKHGPITLIDEIMHIDGRPIRPNRCKHAGSWRPAASTILVSDASRPDGFLDLNDYKLPWRPLNEQSALTFNSSKTNGLLHRSYSWGGPHCDTVLTYRGRRGNMRPVA
jgi:hypothetical protein